MNVKIEIPALMVMASALLKSRIVDAQRVVGKQYFRELEKGNPVLLSDVKLEDNSTMRFSLSMNTEEFRGPLNFSAFRNQVIMLIDTYAKFLETEQQPRVMSDDGNVQHVIFVPVISQMQNNLNALVMAFEQRNNAEIRLQLMFVDPEQFVAKG